MSDKTRQKALDVTKTIFGLATGRIRHESGDQIAAANGLMAFQEFPEMVAAGYFKKPGDDLTERGDFEFLLEHVTDEPALAYVKKLDKHVMEQLADSAESLFVAIVKNPSIIPMSESEKRQVIKAMASA